MTPTPHADTRRAIYEDIEWFDTWIPHFNDKDLPHVLLIGDSITRAYYPEVEKRLEGRAYVGRIATSRSIGDETLVKELDLALSQKQYDVIHFNNGMHGWGYTEAEFKQFFPELLGVIRQHQPQAKLVWGSITPVREYGNIAQFEARTERVKVRNSIALEILSKEKIPINDLFQIGWDHTEYYSNDGVHFNEKGSAVLADQVASAITKLL